MLPLSIHWEKRKQQDRPEGNPCRGTWKWQLKCRSRAICQTFRTKGLPLQRGDRELKKREETKRYFFLRLVGGASRSSSGLSSCSQRGKLKCSLARERMSRFLSRREQVGLRNPPSLSMTWDKTISWRRARGRKAMNPLSREGIRVQWGQIQNRKKCLPFLELRTMKNRKAPPRSRALVWWGWLSLWKIRRKMNQVMELRRRTVMMLKIKWKVY